MIRSALLPVALLAILPLTSAAPLVVPTYTEGAPRALRQGLAVQHFAVPYGCVGTQLDFYCDVSSAKDLGDQEVALQVYSADRQHLATASVKVSTLPNGRGWVSLPGLTLRPGAYCAQLFTNSQALGPYVNACIRSRSNYRGGYAAAGWEGGDPLGQGQDFQARLICERRDGLPPKPKGDTRFLAEGKIPHYTIVLADDAPLVEQTAATELRTAVKALCGATLPVILERDYRGGPMVAVGFNRRLPPAMRPAAFGALSEDQLIIKPGDGVLLLAGGEPCGALYAVYEFLHRLGVRWYSPDFTVTPHLDRIPLPAETIGYSPPVTGRQVVVGVRDDPAWLSRNRFTTMYHWGAVGREYGRPTAEGPDMHTVWRMVSADVLREHPDWASEVGGKRTLPININTWDLCYTNPDARRYFIDRTVEWAREHPDIKTVWIGQNDSGMVCECERCRAFYAAHGGKASSVIVRLVNDLADALVVAGLTDRRVKTLAYGWSAEPPEGMRVSDNATIMVCRYPLVAAWRRIAGNVAVYLYGNYSDYWSPDPTLYSDAEQVIGAWRDGANNLYMTISGHGGTTGSDLVDLRGWLTARLMWDPTADPQALINDFCRGYYGPAAEAVLRSLSIRHTRFHPGALSAADAGEGLGVPDYVNPTALRDINVLLGKAYEALPPGVFRDHLEMAWLSSLWADFWLGAQGLGRFDAATSTWSVPWSDAETRAHYGALAVQFMLAHGVNTLGEQKHINPRELGIGLVGHPWPALRFQEGTTQAVVVPAVGGLIADLRDTAANFAPLKPCWGEMLLRYPMFSSTGDSIGGAQVQAYRETESGPNRVVMEAQQGGCRVVKTVALEDRRLTVNLTAHNDDGTQPELLTEVMFDLLDAALGLHPSVFVEQEGGTWTRRDMGTETEFWWVEGPLELGDPTGRIVIASQTQAAGLCLTFDPEQLGSLEFWYDRIMDHYQKREQEGMLRLFLRPRGATGGEAQLHYGLEILPQARAVVGG